MKTKSFIAVILLVIISSCTKRTQPDFLYLNAAQLKPLGIVLNDKGVFYKNENPNWKQNNEKYAGMAFYCNGEIFVSTTQFHATDTLKAKNSADSIIASLELTKNDFYPLLIGNNKGIQSFDNENLPSDIKLLPVAIRMAETNLPNRKDTVIIWLRPTESLKRLLPEGIKMEDYLRTKMVGKESM
jgi:hypothetical protein